MNDPEAKGQRIVGPVLGLLKVVGASLAGLTAVLSAAGFLAERARLTMLGLPSSTFDLEQYIETGARLVALMPILLVLALLLLLLTWLTSTPGVLITALGGTGLLVGYLFRRRRRARAGAANPALAAELPSGGDPAPTEIAAGRTTYWFAALLALALILQFVCLERQVSVLERRDVLFAPEASGSDAQDAASTAARGATAVTVIGPQRSSDRQNEALQFFGLVVMVTVFNGGLLAFVVRHRFPASSPRSTRARVLVVWTAVTALMLISQITFVPVTYGALLAATNFPEVCVEYTRDRDAWPDPPPDERLALVHQTGDGFYFYSRTEEKMWYVLRGSVAAMVQYAPADVLDSVPARPCPTRGEP